LALGCRAAELLIAASPSLHRSAASTPNAARNRETIGLPGRILRLQLPPEIQVDKFNFAWGRLIARGRKVKTISTDEHLEARLQLLRSVGTEEMPHSEQGLFDHLLGTRQLLIEWGARPVVCDAGLFHSIYGTEHYGPTAIAPSRRAEVRQLIGEEAEKLAWLFCVMRRATFEQNLQRTGEFTVQNRKTGEWLPLGADQFQDLVTMTFANTLEAFPRLSWRTRRSCRNYLRAFKNMAAPNAWAAFKKCDARWWEFWKMRLK